MELTFKLRSNQFKKILGEYVTDKFNYEYEEIKSIVVNEQNDGYTITVEVKDDDEEENEDDS